MEEHASSTELRALEVIKGIRHPNLLATFGTWQIGEAEVGRISNPSNPAEEPERIGNPSYLVIATELADRSLWDRFREVTAQGLPGIARDELLEYFQEAAKGIDFLNSPQHALGGNEPLGIQHRDIKPQNILLAGGGVKVADFGLARWMAQTVASHTGHLTPAYAPPEFFSGHTTAQSDQYSLAVTYYHLRTGQLPQFK